MVWFIENLLEKECLLNFQSKTNDVKPFDFSQTKGEFSQSYNCMGIN